MNSTDVLICVSVVVCHGMLSGDITVINVLYSAGELSILSELQYHCILYRYGNRVVDF